MKHSLLFEKFLLNFCLLFLVLFNIPNLQSQTSSCGWTISSNTYFTFSNSTNTQIWNGATWVSALEITCTAADAVWLTALGPGATRFWGNLYDNGACWVSIPLWDSAYGNFSRKFKQIVTPSVSLTNVRIDFCVDDSLTVYLDGAYIGSGSQFNRLNSVNLGNLSATTHEISFEVFNTRPHYFGFIYGIRGDTVRSECDWPITRFDYCIDSSSGRHLVSNSSNVKMWSGTNWFAAVDVPSTTADLTWGTGGLGISPPFPWHLLYDNGACWISRNASGGAIRNPDTLYFRHSFALGGSSCTLHRLTIDFCVDDTVNIYYNHTGAFAPPGGTLVGSGGQFAAVNSVSFFVIGNNVTIDFEVISTRPNYIGLIYGIRCEEIPFTCDSIRINITRASSAEDTSGCCYQFNILNPFSSALPINSINFVTVAPNSISSAIGPTGWTLVNLLPNTQARFNDVSLQPGNNIFTLCFTGSNPTCTVYLYFYNQCDCKYPFDLYCQNCCDSFRTNIRSSVYQISSQYILLTTTFNSILPNPNLVRVLSYVAYARNSSSTSPHMFFDLWRAKSTYGTPPSWSSWQPPSTPPGTQLGRQITFPASGLSGIWGAHRTQPGFSRELIWGDYDLRNSTQVGVINGYSFRTIFKIPPIGPNQDVKIGLRYLFTDTSCCTCDTLVESSFRTWIDLDPVSSTIILDSEEKGNITILKRNPPDPEDSMFVPVRYDFQCEIKDATILQIRDLSNGTIFLPDENGICKATPILQNDSGHLEIYLSNPKKLNRIPLKVTEILLFEGDSIPVDYQIIALHKTTGDELTIYDDGKPKNPQIVMVLLKNNNTFKENISHIIIKPKNNEKLIAVGSDAINLKAQMGIYAPQGKEDGLKILPEAFTDSESSELEPQQEIKPIYLVFEPDNDKNAEFIFETYNKNNEIIAEGTINIPVTAVQDINTKNELIANLTISPNPSSDYISISFFSNDILQNVAFNIYDLGGKFIGTIHNYSFIPIGINSILYSVASLPSGAYILQIKGNEFELTTTFVITR